jgi:hypothetical protein
MTALRWFGASAALLLLNACGGVSYELHDDVSQPRRIAVLPFGGSAMPGRSNSSRRSAGVWPRTFTSAVSPAGSTRSARLVLASIHERRDRFRAIFQAATPEDRRDRPTRALRARAQP